MRISWGFWGGYVYVWTPVGGAWADSAAPAVSEEECGGPPRPTREGSSPQPSATPRPPCDLEQT
mgnify:CR=1 FL=1